ncbi:MAG: GDSL-type esterase/lipase family protein, partial [Bacteroidota bacterium]
MKQRLWIVYLVCVHLLVGVMLWKSDFTTKVAQKIAQLRTGCVHRSTHHCLTLAQHKRSLDSLPAGGVLFIGDSITQDLPADEVAPGAVNLGIGGDTTDDVLERLPVYEGITEHASAIVLAVGVNDLTDGSEAETAGTYRRVLESLPPVPILISSILPTDGRRHERFADYPERIARVNQQLKALAQAFPHAH